MWSCSCRAVRDILYFVLSRTINTSHSSSNLSYPVGLTPSPRAPYPASPLTGLTEPSASVLGWGRPPGRRGTASTPPPARRTSRGFPTIGTTKWMFEAAGASSLLLVLSLLLPALRISFNESATGWHYENICI